MKKMRHLIGGIVLCAAFWAVIAINTFVFPIILAGTPDRTEIKTIEAISVASIKEEETAEIENTKDTANINNIPEKEAILTAAEELVKTYVITRTTCYASLLSGSAPVNDAAWIIIFQDEEEEVRITIDAKTGDIKSKATDNYTIDEKKANTSNSDDEDMVLIEVKEYVVEIDSNGNIQVIKADN